MQGMTGAPGGKYVLCGGLIQITLIILLITCFYVLDLKAGSDNFYGILQLVRESEFHGRHGVERNGEVQTNGVAAGGQEGPRFALYRLIGNNMPPLQCPSQLLWNTEYALEHEADLPGCKRRWILNQIMNATERALILDALVAKGYTLDDIIIRPLNLTKLAESPQAKWGDAVTAQNEARNDAIDDGIRLGVRWILPFDGNHFITEEAWGSIVRSADRAEAKGYKYFKVPVHRLHQEQDPSWVNASSRFRDIRKHAPMMIESQLAFRYDAPERFQTGMMYGQKNKLELLARTCGSPEDPGYQERCGCSDLGEEGQLHKSNVTLAQECGYSLRLWFYPCKGTDPDKVFFNGLYRKRMRTSARKELFSRIKTMVRHPGRLQE